MINTRGKIKNCSDRQLLGIMNKLLGSKKQVGEVSSKVAPLADAIAIQDALTDVDIMGELAIDICCQCGLWCHTADLTPRVTGDYCKSCWR
jgi:hypothetical protein